MKNVLLHESKTHIKHRKNHKKDSILSIVLKIGDANQLSKVLKSKQIGSKEGNCDEQLKCTKRRVRYQSSAWF